MGGQQESSGRIAPAADHLPPGREGGEEFPLNVHASSQAAYAIGVNGDRIEIVPDAKIDEPDAPVINVGASQ
jgi:hypothetical protein